MTSILSKRVSRYPCVYGIPGAENCFAHSSVPSCIVRACFLFIEHHFTFFSSRFVLGYWFTTRIPVPRVTGLHEFKETYFPFNHALDQLRGDVSRDTGHLQASKTRKKRERAPAILTIPWSDQRDSLSLPRCHHWSTYHLFTTHFCASFVSGC